MFDLHWLRSRDPTLECTAHDLALRLATYPNESAAGWIAKAAVRLDELASQGVAVGRDLARWLPSSWPLRASDVAAMLASSGQALRQGVSQMRTLLPTPKPTPKPTPTPTPTPTPPRRKARGR